MIHNLETFIQPAAFPLTVLPLFSQVVRYWPETGKSGFLVWRYMLRRDDEEPAPWTKEGKERMKKLGLTMQVELCPPGAHFWEAAQLVHRGTAGTLY